MSSNVVTLSGGKMPSEALQDWLKENPEIRGGLIVVFGKDGMVAFRRTAMSMAELSLAQVLVQREVYEELVARSIHAEERDGT